MMSASSEKFDNVDKFTTPLVVSPVDSPNPMLWKLDKPFQYYTVIDGKKKYICVPKGFMTDFATIPRFLWSIFPAWDKYGKAAVLHDYLYDYKVFDRKTCDHIFYEAMTVLRVPWWRRRLMYLAVRVFGGKYYNKK